jgi:hypothetical protein
MIGAAMKFLSAEEARNFAEKWLPAWTGNNPERLACPQLGQGLTMQV